LVSRTSSGTIGWSSEIHKREASVLTVAVGGMAAFNWEI
jgi:hypothetical protein